MLKSWLSAIGFILVGIFVPQMLCSAGCNILTEFMSAAAIAVSFHIALYYFVLSVAESFQIQINENDKKKAHIRIGLLSLLIFLLFLYGFHEMESVTVIDLTNVK
jgi:hypothetical protein